MPEGDEERPARTRAWLFSGVFAALWVVLAVLSALKHRWILVGLAVVACLLMASAAFAQRRLTRGS